MVAVLIDVGLNESPKLSSDIALAMTLLCFGFCTTLAFAFTVFFRVDCIRFPRLDLLKLQSALLGLVAVSRHKHDVFLSFIFLLTRLLC